MPQNASEDVEKILLCNKCDLPEEERAVSKEDTDLVSLSP